MRERHWKGAAAALLFAVLLAGCGAGEASGAAQGTDDRDSSGMELAAAALSAGEETEAGEAAAAEAGAAQADTAAQEAAGTGRDFSVSGTLEVHFVDVGQADCILIRDGDAAMLVDAGNNEDGEQVVSYLEAQGIERLEYVIGTHPHEDHIGGLDTVLNHLETENLLLPDKVHTTKTYEEVLDAAENQGLSITLAEPGDVYTLGEAEFTVLGPNADYGDDLNNWSVGIRLVYGDTSFVMTGDAEAEAEQDMLGTGLELRADVWKAAHHGSETSNSAAMLDAVQPKYAVISCGEGNSYGHPHASVLQEFAERGITVFRTDEQGTIIARSDGGTITFTTGADGNISADGSSAKKSGTSDAAQGNSEEPRTGISLTADSGVDMEMADSGVDMETADSGADTDTTDSSDPASVTVHITKTGAKYHRAGCSSLKNSDTEISLEDARKQGYEPCKRCNPPQ